MSIAGVQGISDKNSSSASLASGATFTGEWENVVPFPEITVFVYASQATTLYIDHSTDGVTLHRPLSYSISASTGTPHKVARITKFFRVRLTNNGDSTATVSLQTILSATPKSDLTNNLSGTITDYSDAIVTRAVVAGRTDGGEWVNQAMTPEGHAEVAIHSPKNGFGSIHAEKLSPVVAHSAVYGVQSNAMLTTTNASGTATASDSLFVCTTGTTIYGAGAIQSRKRVPYRPGQGMTARFTGIYSAPAANSYLVLGVGHPEDGAYFGYKGTDFGILVNSRGKRAVHTLTVTVGSSHTESITVKLNDVNYTVTGITNSGSTVKTAWEIAQNTFTGWNAEQVGSTVVFVATSVGARSGAYSVTATSAAGSFATTSAGQAVSEMFIAQTAWNADPLDGTGPSGYDLDHTKINVYQIKIQYLGGGPFMFEVEVPFEGNNPDWVTVHTLNYPNTLTTTSLGNPAFPFTMSAYSAGSTTDISVKCGSFALFVEGDIKYQGNRISFFAQSTGVGAANYQALISIRNTRYFSGRTNQSVIHLMSIAGALKHTSPCTIYLFRNATLAGTPNFSQYATSSTAYTDTAATTCTIASNDQLVWSTQLGDTGDFSFPFTDEITIQPGEVITIAARASTGSPSYVLVSLNVREDQ